MKLNLGQEYEKRATEEAMDKSAGIVAGAARLLGISRTTLLKRLKRYGLWTPRRAKGY